MIGERVAVNSQEEIPPSPKYAKPKILLLDVPGPSATALRSMGFNVSVGTLGMPYKVPASRDYRQLVGTSHVPNAAEQEIVIVDLMYGVPADKPEGAQQVPLGEIALYGKCVQGFLDPRVRTANALREAFDRIHASGGAFVVFADEKTELDIKIAPDPFSQGEVFPHDVWGFLTELLDMRVKRDHGTEIHCAGNDSPLASLLRASLADARFTCTLEGAHRWDDDWKPLAFNKYDEAVALERWPADSGPIIVLPQIADKTRFLTELIENVLPELVPELFPDIEHGRWIHWPDYELARVNELNLRQHEVRQRATAEIAALELSIDQERAANGWIHRLIAGTDTELVEAVKTALSVIGFSKVLDIDVERDREGKSRREDLQINDGTPLVVVDVKGIGGFPSDDDPLQAAKHAAIRMREQKRTDIIGLSIINHQRHLPPLERENTMPFRQELIDAAEQQTLGLITAWDLYRLVRNLRKLGWRSEDIKPLFYERGRIEAVPKHYQLVGAITRVWSETFGVLITAGELRVGDRVALEFPIEFEEIEVKSIQINDESVQSGAVGDPVGLRWPTGMPRLRKGMRVFRVRASG